MLTLAKSYRNIVLIEGFRLRVDRVADSALDRLAHAVLIFGAEHRSDGRRRRRIRPGGEFGGADGHGVQGLLIRRGRRGISSGTASAARTLLHPMRFIRHRRWRAFRRRSRRYRRILRAAPKRFASRVRLVRQRHPLYQRMDELVVFARSACLLLNNRSAASTAASCHD